MPTNVNKPSSVRFLAPSAKTTADLLSIKSAPNVTNNAIQLQPSSPRSSSVQNVSQVLPLNLSTNSVVVVSARPNAWACKLEYWLSPLYLSECNHYLCSKSCRYVKTFVWFLKPKFPSAPSNLSYNLPSSSSVLDTSLGETRDRLVCH